LANIKEFDDLSATRFPSASDGSPRYAFSFENGGGVSTQYVTHTRAGWIFDRAQGGVTTFQRFHWARLEDEKSTEEKLMKHILAGLALALAALFAIPAHAQTAAPIPFTLSWESNRSINTTFFVHSLLSYNGQPVTYPVCGHSAEGYNIWCGEVVHFASNPTLDPVDFNFPDKFLLESCSQAASQLSTVYTSPSRRTITVNATFSCADMNAAPWTVQTVTKSKQYLASCGRYACWQTFTVGQQSPITGTVTQD
jgi:hypothetical protein